jgi:hypothetical protein
MDEERTLRIEGRNTVKVKGNFYGKTGMNGSDYGTDTTCRCGNNWKVVGRDIRQK